MKKLLLVACAVALMGCAPRMKPYTVRGEVDASHNGAMVYMSDYHLQGEVVDSALVENGQFCFSGKMRGDSLYRLELGRVSANVIVEGGEDVVVDFERRGATGSEKNRIKNDYDAAEDAYFNENAQLRARLAADTTLSEEEQQAKRVAIFTQRRTERMEQVKELIRQNSNNATGAYIMWTYLVTNHLSPEEFDAIYALAGDYLRGFSPIQKCVEEMEVIKRTSPGMMFTDFAIEGGNPDGSTAKLSDYVGRGKYVLVDFWASWCVPCREEIPFIRKAWNAFQGERFEVVGVAVRDAPKATQRAIEELHLPWPQILNAQRIPSEVYGFNGIPFLILFGPDGTIIERGLRGERIYETIQEELAE